MIYIIAAEHVADNNKVSYGYMFDAEGCDLDKVWMGLGVI